VSSLDREPSLIDEKLESRATGATTQALGLKLLRIVSKLPVLAVALVVWKYRLGSDSVVRLHDTLDSYYAIFGPLSIGDLFAAPGTNFDLLLGGTVGRDALGSEFHLGYVLAAGLPLMWSLAVSELLVRLMAFFSMRMLLGRIGLGSHTLIVYGVSTLFSVLPFYLPAFGAVAASPFLLAMLIDVWDRSGVSRRVRWAMLGFPLVANAAYVLPFIFVLALASLGLGLWRGLGRVRPLVTALAWLGLGVVIIDWRIFWSLLSASKSHRVEMFSPKIGGSALWNGLGPDLLREVQHIWLGRSVLMGVVVACGVLVVVAGREVLGSRQRRFLAASMGAVIVTTTIARVWPWFEVRVVKEISADWARFQLGRVRFLEPALLYVILALALVAIGASLDRPRAGAATTRTSPASRRAFSVLVLVVLVIQGAYIINQQDFRRNPSSLTPREYYAQGSMTEIKAALADTPDPRVVSIGLHPAVAVYNGIPSADGYWNQYPLDYKTAFRTLIAPALDANPADATYFDAWGSRAYVFQPELGRPSCCARPRGGEIELLIDPVALETLGISHLISSVTFSNANSLGLGLVLETRSEAELGPLYLYERVG